MAMAMGGDGEGGIVDINMTPLIDVLLVLLIIFMVITPLTPKGLEALVPQPNENGEAAEEARENLLAKYPASDYASYLSENVQVETKAQEAAYLQAESQIPDNVNNAIQ